MSTELIKDVVTGVERILLIIGVDPAIFPVSELVHEGKYIRQTFIPAGYIGTGKIHNKSAINIIASGHLQLYSDAMGRQDITGPFTFPSPIGSKRLFKVHTDTHWINIFTVNATTIEDARAECYSDSWEEFRLKTEEI